MAAARHPPAARGEIREWGGIANSRIFTARYSSNRLRSAVAFIVSRGMAGADGLPFRGSSAPPARGGPISPRNHRMHAARSAPPWDPSPAVRRGGSPDRSRGMSARRIALHRDYSPRSLATRATASGQQYPRPGASARPVTGATSFSDCDTEQLVDRGLLRSRVRRPDPPLRKHASTSPHPRSGAPFAGRHRRGCPLSRYHR